MLIKKTDNAALTVVIILSFLVFIQINAGEVQPWDEGLYSARAKSILEHGCFWDQTQYTIGGLYSATSPPLFSWMMAASMAVFGENLLGIRFFPAICSFFSVILLFFIAHKIISKDYTIAVPILLLVSLVWNTYSRQGMTDIPLVMFFLICIYSLIRLYETVEFSKALLWGLVFCLAFAAALLTKIVISALPLLFVILFSCNRGKGIQKGIIVLASIFSILIALPWYFYMGNTYGIEFTNALLVPHIFSIVENNTRNLGILYYVNQLIISNPILIISIVLSFVYFFKFKLWQLRSENLESFLMKSFLIWFIAALLIFSLSRTKLENYSVYLIPSGVMLSVYFYERLGTIIKTEKKRAVLHLLMIIATIWSFSTNLRLSIKVIFGGDSFSSPAIIIIIIFIITAIALLYSKQRNLKFFKTQLYPKIWLIIIIMVTTRIVAENMLFPIGNTFGGAKTAQILEKSRFKSFIYLYHEYAAADSLNPQLDWYTKGWFNGKRYDRLCFKVPLNPQKMDYRHLRIIDNYPNIPLIYYLPQDKTLATQVIADISETRPIVEQYQNYLIWGLKEKEHIRGSLISNIMYNPY
jgi:4-amino-4-deoxy-L-arabinose transferase-like glycosyltransferase